MLLCQCWQTMDCVELFTLKVKGAKAKSFLEMVIYRKPLQNVQSDTVNMGIMIVLLNKRNWGFLKKLEWIREMCSEQKHRCILKIFQGALPQDSLISQSPLLICPGHVAGLDSTNFDLNCSNFLCLYLPKSFPSTLNWIWRLMLGSNERKNSRGPRLLLLRHYCNHLIWNAHTLSQ